MYLNAIRFFYLQVLERDEQGLVLNTPKRKQRIPELLSRAEVARLLSAVRNRKHRLMLATCYGCGLRVSELMALRVSDIDGERALLRIRQGKGGKDRQIILSPTLLQRLRHYWRVYHPIGVLFYGRDPLSPLGISTAQKVFQVAKQRAGIDKIGGIHSLRHAYATHQLAAGMPLLQLKEMLGHNDVHSTMRYLHWVPQYRAGQGMDLLKGLEVGDE